MLQNFIDVLKRKFIEFKLGDNQYRIERPGLGLHLQLGQILQAINGEAEVSVLTGNLLKFLELVGISPEDISLSSGTDILKACCEIQVLNELNFVLPFLLDEEAVTGKKRPDYGRMLCEYEGREWAVVIHRIASRYGWSHEEVLSLYSEVVIAYMQEIIISDYDETELIRLQSELNYKRIPMPSKQKGVTQYQLRFQPNPGYWWMMSPKPKRKKPPINPAHLPAGVIFDVTKLDEKQ